MLLKIMNPILLSFLCGAAFIGGAAVVVIMVAMAVSLKEKEYRNSLLGYWREANSNQISQIAALKRIADALEKKS